MMRNPFFRMTDETLLQWLDRDARHLSARFRLPLVRLDQEHLRVKRRFGSCDSEGVIRLRLRNRRNGDYLRYSSLVATLCHELAHLRFMDHGHGFRSLYAEILRFARATEIYRPRAVPAGRKTSSRRAALNPRRRTGRGRRTAARRPAR